MCSACIIISPAGVEERRRGVAALLDVRGVRGADQHRAHLLARRPQRAGDHLQLDRVERPRRPSPDREARSPSAPRSIRPGPSRRMSKLTVPWSSTSPGQPGGTSSVASGSAHSAGPSIRSPAGRLPGAAPRLCAPSSTVRAGARGARAPRRAAGRGVGAEAHAETRDRHQLDLRRARRGSRSAARGPRRRPRAASPGRRRRRASHRQLEGLAAVAQLVAHALSPPRPPAPELARASQQLLARGRRRSARSSLGREHDRPRDVAARRRRREAERGEHAAGARAEHALDAELWASAAACSGPAPPKAISAKPRGSTPRSTVITRSARSISASATRTMPSAHSSSSSAELARQRADARSRGIASSSHAARERRVRRAAAEQQVRVGDGRLAAAAPVAGGAGMRRPPSAARRAARRRRRARRSSRRPRRPCGCRAPAARAVGPPTARSPSRAPRRRDHADVAGGAAHVEAQHVPLARDARRAARARDAAGRAREHRERGVRGGARAR